MTITEAVKKIMELKGLDIFKNLKQFLAFLDDLAPEYQKERKIIKNNFDENILGLFVDESKRPNQRLRWVQIKLDDVGLAKDWADFIIESFGIAFGWEQEVQDLKVNAPILNNAPKANPQQQTVNPNVQDVTLNDDVLKQWGFTDKNSIPTVLNIPSTYKTVFGITYRIVKIGDEVFKDCDKLQIVTIPDTVKEIGDSGFANCKALEKINIPDSVNKIGKRSFVNCKALNSITLQNDITEIGDGAFCGCESLITAVIPNKVTKIAEGLFGNCKSIVNITIPNGVTEIGNLAFAGCEALNSVIIPKSVTKIGSKAFANCKSIDSIIIPNTVTDIGTEAFGGCENLQQFTLPTRFTVFKDDVKKKSVDLTTKGQVQQVNLPLPTFVEDINKLFSKKYIDVTTDEKNKLKFYIDLLFDSKNPTGAMQVINNLIKVDSSWVAYRDKIVDEFKQKAISSNSDMTNIFNLGIIYKELKQYDDAIKQFQATKKQYEFFIDSAIQIALCFNVKPGMKSLATRTLSKDIMDCRFKDSEKIEMKYVLAGFYEAAGKNKEALNLYIEIETEQKGYKDVSKKISLLNLDNKVSSNNETISQLQKDKTKEQDIRYKLAETYYNLGLYEDALAMYEECYAVDIEYKDVGEKIAKIGEMIE